MVEAAGPRPTVSVIVPFAGAAPDLTRLLSVLSRLTLGPGDEVIVADNRKGDPGPPPGRIRVVDATGIRTPAFARNCGARYATGEWLVFIDADTSPAPALLDGYFAPAPDERTGVLAGEIRDVVDLVPIWQKIYQRSSAGPTPVAAHSAARAHMSQETTMRRARPYAQTANCAVRRRAFEQVGGFEETARAGEDAELCFRLQVAGWGIEERPGAVVEHGSRQTLPALLAQLARHGSGAAWVNRRFPGSFPPPPAWRLARRFARDARAAATAGNGQAARFALLDLAGGLAFELGRLLPNRRGLRHRTSGTHIGRHNWEE